jgi:hypothetical protein
MGLFDTIKNLGRRAASGISRTVGQIAHGVRRVADVTKPVVMGAARFVRDHHQPLAMLAHGVGEATGHPALKNLGNAAMIGSGLASAAGIGRDYIGLNRQAAGG